MKLHVIRHQNLLNYILEQCQHATAIAQALVVVLSCQNRNVTMERSLGNSVFVTAKAHYFTCISSVNVLFSSNHDLNLIIPESEIKTTQFELNASYQCLCFLKAFPTESLFFCATTVTKETKRVC